MATQLGAQLQVLAPIHGQPTKQRPGTRPSLFFDPVQAADTDLQTIFSIALEALEKLAEYDGQFESYRKTLFSPQSCHTDREVQPKEFNLKLDKSISEYLRLLSGYLMLDPAPRTLEYLIRRYNVHVHNVDQVMTCILPYHETRLFVETVKLLKIQGSKWSFLAGVQRSGAPPPRQALVERCSKDLALLDAIVDVAILESQSAKSRNLITFSTVFITEVLAAVPIITSELVNRIVHFLLHSFKVGVHEDFQVGALMIICTLASKSSLSPDLVATFFELIAKRIQKKEDVGSSLLQLSIRVLVVFTQTQAIKQLPIKAFKFLVKVGGLPAILVELGQKFEIGTFKSLFLNALVDHCMAHEHYESALLEVIKAVPIEDEVVPLVSRLVDRVLEEQAMVNSEAAEGLGAGPTKARSVVTRLLRTIEHHYPKQMDIAVSTVLQQNAERKGDASSVFDFLRDVLHGSLHVPLAETQTSLLLSLDHPNARIRQAAVESLSEVVPKIAESEDIEMSAVVRDVLSRRILDDDFGVTHAVLTIKDLVKFLPPQNAFEALRALLNKCRKNMDGKAKSVAKVAIKLAGDLAEQNPDYLEGVAFFLLDYLLILPKTWKLHWSAFTVCQQLSYPLFNGLASIDALPPEAHDDGMSAKNRKQKRRVWLSSINSEIVRAVSTSLMTNLTQFLPLLAKSIKEGHSRALVMLVLLQSLSTEKIGGTRTALENYFCVVKQEWENFISNNQIDGLQVPQIDYQNWDSGVSPEFYYNLETTPHVAYYELLLHTLYKLTFHTFGNNLLELKNQKSDDAQSLTVNLFVLLAGSSSPEAFEPHMALVTKELSARLFSFLSGFFTQDGSLVPALVQTRALDLFASSITRNFTLSSNEAEVQGRLEGTDVLMAWPALLVALTSNRKAVRKGALECLKQLHSWAGNEERHLPSGLGNQQGAPKLSAKLFVSFLGALIAQEKMFLADGTHLKAFFVHCLSVSPSDSQTIPPTPLTGRFDRESQKAIVMYLAASAQLMSSHPHSVLLSSLLDVGHNVELAVATESLLSQFLQKRRLGHLSHSSTVDQKIKNADLQLITILLRVYTPHVAAAVSSASSKEDDPTLAGFFEALTVEGGSLTDPAVEQPCIAAIGCVTPDFYRALDVSSQDSIFQTLLSLSTLDSVAIRAASRGAVWKLDVTVKSLSKHAYYIVGDQVSKTKRKRAKHGPGDCSQQPAAGSAAWPKAGQFVATASALLELLFGMPSKPDRHMLLDPLFLLLGQIITKKWPQSDESSQEVGAHSAAEGEVEGASMSSVTYVEQLTIMTLEKITCELADNIDDSLKDGDISSRYDIDLIVDCVSRATDPVTRNHALALLTAAGKLYPQRVLSHVIDIVSVIGASVVTQDVTHSHEVVYQMLATIVPDWLESTQRPAELFEVFVSALPRVPTHRRLALVTNLMRVTKVEYGLHIFLWLLVQDFVNASALTNGEKQNESQAERWQLRFAAEICEQYDFSVQLPAFVRLLELSRAHAGGEKIQAEDSKSKAAEFWTLQQTALNLVVERLHASDLLLLDKEASLQDAYVGLLEQVLLQLQLAGSTAAIALHSHKLKKKAQDSAYALLDLLIGFMAPSAFTKSMASLLKHPDTRIRRKVLRLFTAKMAHQLQKGGDVGKNKGKAGKDKGTTTEVYDLKDSELHRTMVTEIMGVLSDTGDDASLSTKHAAILALDMYTQIYQGSSLEIFLSCFPTLVSHFNTTSHSIAPAAVKCVASIFRLLGVQALPALPDTVKELLKISQNLQANASEDYESNNSDGVFKMCLAILTAFQALVEKLPLYLSPYLADIVGVVVLQETFIRSPNVEVAERAKTLRSLLPDKVPARLLLDPLINSFEKAILAGEASTSGLFQMVAQLAANLDKTSLALYHGKIFNLCIRALDLRRKVPSTFSTINNVEADVVRAFVALVMKLGESTFRPLFVRTMEWAQSTSPDGEEDGTGHNVYRSISFFRLVNELADKLRSLFVPYFKYFLDGCVHHLTGGKQAEEQEAPRPKKRRKQGSAGTLSPSEWHVRVLVVTSLQKCFLYDTVSFLDATRFQLLLKPLVKQLGVQGPTSARDTSDDGSPLERLEMPTEKEMDEVVVSCLGQMALAAGTDEVWQQLNHEVLMKTRSDDVRTRLLALEVINFLVQRLREEYLTLLPETIRFLGELLEDSELTVVAKAQELFKLLEELSGEDLKQHLS